MMKPSMGLQAQARGNWELISPSPTQLPALATVARGSDLSYGYGQEGSVRFTAWRLHEVNPGEDYLTGQRSRDDEQRARAMLCSRSLKSTFGYASRSSSPCSVHGVADVCEWKIGVG